MTAETDFHLYPRKQSATYTYLAVLSESPRSRIGLELSRRISRLVSGSAGPPPLSVVPYMAV